MPSWSKSASTSPVLTNSPPASAPSGPPTRAPRTRSNAKLTKPPLSSQNSMPSRSVHLPPLPLSSPLSPGPREARHLPLGWRRDDILPRPDHSRPGGWPRGCQVADRESAPLPCLRPRPREVPPLGLSILQQARPSRNLCQSRPRRRQAKV